MRHRESSARSLAMRRQQLLPKSEVLKGEILARSEAAENPAKKMPQERNHAQNLNGNTRTTTLSKYLILRIRQVLRRHRSSRTPVPQHLAQRRLQPCAVGYGGARSAFRRRDRRQNKR